MQRVIGLDIHKDSATYAMVALDGRRLQSGRFAATREAIEEFARSLSREDTVALEATTNAWAFHDRLAPRVGEVAIANPLKVHLIAQAHLKTDAVWGGGGSLASMRTWLPTVACHAIELSPCLLYPSHASI